MLPPLLLACLVAQAAAQEGCPQEDILIGPGASFSGSVRVYNRTQYVLEGDSGGIPDQSGIHVVAGCKSDSEKEVVLSIVELEGNKYFALNDNPARIEDKLIQLRENYKTNLNFPLPETMTFHLKACDTTNVNCVTAPVTITFNTFNGDDPKLSQPKAMGSVNLASCPKDSGVQCNTEVDFTQEITASSTGGVGVEFILDRSTPNAHLFTVSSLDGKLGLNFTGVQNDFTSNTTVVLVVKAREERPDARSATIPVVVEVWPAEPETGATTTSAPEDGEPCDSDLERKYFISMLVLGACLGGLLTAILLLLLWCCCSRCCSCTGSGSSDFGPTTKPSMQPSGVLRDGASFKSFKDTTYLTLQEVPSSPGSTSDSLPAYEPRTRYGGDSDSTASAGDTGELRRGSRRY